MITLWSSPDTLMARALESYLSNLGFSVMVRGEDRAGSAGMLPVNECWSEVVLVETGRESDAKAQVATFFAAKRQDTNPWRCEKCGEELESQFSDCWRCSAPPEFKTTEARKIARQSLLHKLLFAQISLVVISLVYQSGTLRGAGSQSMGNVLATYAHTDSMAVFLAYHLLLALSVFGLLVSWNAARYLYAGLWVLTGIAEASQYSTSTNSAHDIFIAGFLLLGVAILFLVWRTVLKDDFVKVSQIEAPEIPSGPLIKIGRRKN